MSAKPSGLPMPSSSVRYFAQGIAPVSHDDATQRNSEVGLLMKMQVKRKAKDDGTKPPSTPKASEQVIPPDNTKPYLPLINSTFVLCNCLEHSAGTVLTTNPEAE
uniref:Uncharacterized protein n=1 Tax=Oryza brachyantha TaxID=4533 RepID=J3NE65_ORYBR